MSETTFADVEDEYQHIICQAEDRGICGAPQGEVVWFTIPCSVCLLVKEMQPPLTCPLRGGICNCLRKE